MLSKNNYKERLRKMEQKKERFSIRKFSVGAASVLIGFFFMGVGSQTTVHADTVTPQVETAKSNENTAKAEAETTDEAKAPASQAVEATSSAASDVASSQASSSASSAAPASETSVKNSEAKKETTNTVSVKDLESNSAAAKELTVSKAVTSSAATSSAATHANGTGGYTEYGITVPSVTEPEASEFWKEFNQLAQPMSKEDLAKLGLDENTYYESATNKTKWHAVSWLSSQNSEGNNVELGTFLYHNPDGSIGMAGQKESWIGKIVEEFLLNSDNIGNLPVKQHLFLVPIISGTSTIYINKGTALTYEDIKRALASNSENITGLVSGNWVTDEQGAGVKVVDINTPGLQEGAVRLTYVNGTKTSASINVDVVDLQGDTTYVNVDSPVPEADSVISGQPANSTNIKWLTKPDLSKAGVTTGTVQVTYPDSTTGSATVIFNVEDPKSKDITVHVGQDITPDDVVVPGTYPAASKITWVTEPNTDIAGKQNVSVVVTYPNNVSSHEIPAVVTVIAPTGKDITTPNGKVPSAEQGIGNVPDMPAGTTYTWKETPEVKTPGKKPAVVVVTFPDSKTVDVPVTVTVEDPIPTGKDITTPNGKVPSAEQGIGNVPDMPAGTKYNWKETPEVKTPGNKPAVVVVTFPDGKTVDVPVTVTVEDPIPTGKDITTPNGKVPSAEQGIGNVPDMPAGTKYNWKETPEVKTPGNKPAVVVVTFPDGKTVDVPVTVTVEDPIPQGQDIHTPQGVVPDPSKGISNVPDMPAGTKYTWKDTPDVTTPGNKPGVVVVTFPDGKTVDVPVTVVVNTPETPVVPQPTETDPTPQGQDIHTPQGVVPDPSKGISNVPDMPAGTKYTWKDTPDVTTPGNKPGVVVVTFPDGKTVDVPVTVIVDTPNTPETPVAPKATEPKPQGQDIHTPQGVVPDPSKGISNIPDMPAGTKYTWKDTPDVTTPGNKPAVVVVTFPDSKTVDVPVTVTVEDPIPTGKDITTPNGKVPSAEQGIGNVPDMPAGTKYNWKETPEVKTPGNKPAVVVVTFPDGKTVDVPVTVTVEDPIPTGKDITTPNGKVPSAEQGIGNVPDMPAGTKYNWKETPEVKTPGNKPAVVVVTFPDGKTVDVPVTVTVEDPIPQGQDIHTPQGVVPDPSKGISNVPDMPAGTKYTWKDTPDVTTPGNKPGVVVVTFPDGKTVDVPVTVVVNTPETPVVPQPTETDPTPQGQDIHTPQGVVPDPSKGISNVPDMPAGTKYTWKDTPDVTTPGNKPGVVVVTFPDGKTVDVPVTVIVDTPNTPETPVAPKATEPKPQGQDIHTPQGVVPDPSKGISNIPDMPAGTKYTWKDTPDVTTPGNKPAVVVVTFPDGKTVEVPVTVVVEPKEEVAPVHPADVPTSNGGSSSVRPISENTKEVVAPVKSTQIPTRSSKKTTNYINAHSKALPQTGAKESTAAMLGVIIATIGAMMGLAAEKKRRN
ncbi:Rib/alpha-like domain-containing protein [Lactobacillus sp. PV012]|uniref:Rib/alpha-like domain-containing protein n=1 Tax=Lactobacillus sp. PV012 TaxID=2594494 RepID=UPI00223EDD9B|nr:Rib/alpha-like domain-containing protein [Lactobacillus sp. PV012]QNQ82655.1 YSIRK-type signal peptide-containing protein [Lactobacillus sp. PV012]